MAVTALQSTTGSALNVTTLQSLATAKLTVSAATTLRVAAKVMLTGLTNTAATITVKIRNTTDSRTLDQFAVAKDVATDTGVTLHLGPYYLAGGSATATDYTIQVLSSNASDTNASWQVDWFDAAASTLSSADIRTALGMADDDLDTQLDAVLAASSVARPTGDMITIVMPHGETEPMVPLFVVDPAGDATTLMTGVQANAIQRLYEVSDPGEPQEFTVTFDGETTVSLYGRDSASMQIALEALPNIGVGDVSCSMDQSDVLVEFTGALAGMPQPLMTVTMIQGEGSFAFSEEQTGASALDANAEIHILCPETGDSWTYATTNDTLVVGAAVQYNASVDNSRCRITEIEHTNHPGAYSISLHPTIAAIAGAKSLIVALVKTATYSAQPVLVQLETAVESGLNQAETQAACAAAITAYRPPTKAELDSAVSPLALASTALSTAVWTNTKAGYLDTTITSRHAAGAAVAKSPATLNWAADVSNPPTIGTSTLTTNDLTAAFSTYAGPTKAEMDAAITALAAYGDIHWVTAAGFSTHSASDVKTAMEAEGSLLAQISEDTGTTLPEAISSVSVSFDPQDFRNALQLAATGTTSADGSIDKYLEDIQAKTDTIVVDTSSDDAVSVDHNYGSDDALAYAAANGAGIDNATIWAFTQSDWEAGNRTAAYAVARSVTTLLGRWVTPMMLDPGNYVLLYFKQGYYGPDYKSLTVS